MTDILDELRWRGLLAESTDEQSLAEHLAAGPVTFYVGFDPTAPSLHIGNLVQLIVARHLQAAGHRPRILVGGSTGLIGDPKETGERVMNSKDVVAGWVQQIKGQVSRFVDFTGDHPAQVVNNLDWTASLSTIDFLRDIGKHFPVNRMLAREVVSTRLETGLSYTEFSYVLLQSLDYLNLFREHGVTLQFGGSDQWGNITAGVELVRRVTGQRVHALAAPLITKADGTKFGKTESGTVWLDGALTSPYAFHQFWLNVEDAMVVDYLKVFSPRDHAQIEELAELTRYRPERRAAQQALADDVTTLVHGPEQTAAANAAARALFGRGELDRLSGPVLDGVFAETAGADLSGPGWPTVVDAMAASRVVSSKSAARRAIAEGGAYVNNLKISDPEAALGEADLLDGRYVVLRRGKKTVGVVRLER